MAAQNLGSPLRVVGVFPRPGDPGHQPPSCPEPRFSGVYGFRVSWSDCVNTAFAPFSHVPPTPAVGTSYVNDGFVLDLPWAVTDVIVTPALPTVRGLPVFAQMFVQQLQFDSATNPYVGTPYWAASRGTWFGIGKP